MGNGSLTSVSGGIKHSNADTPLQANPICKHDALTPIIGSSEHIREVKFKIAKLKGQDCNVFVVGESGTGKELFAKRIHSQERKPGRPFVAVNCAAIPSELIESVLFGHEKGSFTGAGERRIGKFELANGGDLFLDEISSLTPQLQAKLLRVLETREIERVGGNQSIKLDFRVISATNDNIEELIAKGHFREDLYYRLRVVELKIAPLRQRRQDIKMLLDYYLMLLCSGRPLKTFSAQALQTLTSYDWPGNIRELRNVVHALVIFSETNVIQVDEVQRELRVRHQGAAAEERDPNAAAALAGKPQVNFKEAVEDFERQIIIEALKRNQWSRKKACLSLGITRNMLYRKIEALGIELSPA